MAIKIAYSTVACPDWTLEQAAARAKEFGYDGLELRTLGAGSTLLASDPALSEPHKVKAILNDAGIAATCLSTSISLHHADVTAGKRAVWETSAALETAAAIGCPFVRVFAHELHPGETRQAVLTRVGERVIRLTEKAAEVGVELLLENAGSFNAAKEWWWLFNLVNSPMVGACWNLANSVAADTDDRGGSRCVNILNSRIRIAKVKDTLVGQGAGYLPLGEGDVGIPRFVQRLMGIGFDSWISVEWDRAWLPSLAPAEEYLPTANKSLRGWIKAIEQEIEDAKPKPKVKK
jgi:sugar phosphate isomerase/epimerase